jgi:low affinity Fe/Cu permease
MKDNKSSSRNNFSTFAKWVARMTGTSAAFILACLVIVVWLACGPFFHYSDTWQLVINTGTTIVTFLMVFLIQCTQNRDSAAVQLKLSELIRAMEGAQNSLADLDDLDDAELETLHKRYANLAQRAKGHMEKRATKKD